jgi:hypothetical protein
MAVTDEEFDDAGLEAFLAEVRPMADDWTDAYPGRDDRTTERNEECR